MFMNQLSQYSILLICILHQREFAGPTVTLQLILMRNYADQNVYVLTRKSPEVMLQHELPIKTRNPNNTFMTITVKNNSTQEIEAILGVSNDLHDCFSSTGFKQLEQSFECIIISQQKRGMERETLAILYRRALTNVKKQQINMDQLSEAEFVNTYVSDPFFQARVDVELQKAQNKMKNNNGGCPLQNEEEWDSLTLRKKSSQQYEKYVEKCKRYLDLIATCK